MEFGKHHDPGARNRILRMVLFSGAVLLAISPALRGQSSDSSDTCLACHGDRDLATQHGKRTVSLFVDGKRFAASVHAKLSCTGCHADLEGKDIPHPQPEKVDCSLCHTEERAQYEHSVHGNAAARGNRQAPGCVNCHGNHDIAPVKDARSPVSPRRSALLCGSCHLEAVARLKDAKAAAASQVYVDSIHRRGLAARGLTIGPNCVSCHSSHDIRSLADAQSSTVRAQVLSRCSACHAGLPALHRQVIKAEAWQSKATTPVCASCHQPHQARLQFSSHGSADAGCLSCHESHNAKSGHDRPALIKVEELGRSRHANIACSQCHSDVTAAHGRPGAPPVKKVDCTSCHVETAERYQHSIHGQLLAKGDTNAPSCTECHGNHHILGKRQPESATFPTNVPDLCARCHREGERAAVRYKGREHQIIGHYTESIHGKGLLKSGLTVTATCISCHSAHGELPASDPESTVNPKNIPVTCGACHFGIEEKFSHSIHSSLVTHTDKPLPVCSDCHTAHSIRRADLDQFRLEIMNTCGRCHAAIAETYFDTYHGKVSRLGYAKTAKCYDCHGAHDIRNVSDPQSHLSAANRVATCRQCHAKANANFAGFLAHATHYDRRKYPVVFWSYWGMTALLVGVFFVSGVHTLLWLPRSLQMRRELKADHAAGSAAEEDLARDPESREEP